MYEEIPEITEIDELQTFVGNKNNKFWIWSGRIRAQCQRSWSDAKHRVNHQKKGIILWNIGDRSHESFEPIWQIIKCWHSFWYVTRRHSPPSRLTTICAYALRWKVYPMYIQSEDHLVSKTYMTRVEGENTRLRHYLARLHRKTLCYSKSLLLLKYSLRLLLHYLRFGSLQISF